MGRAKREQIWSIEDKMHWVGQIKWERKGAMTWTQGKKVLKIIWCLLCPSKCFVLNIYFAEVNQTSVTIV